MSSSALTERVIVAILDHVVVKDGVTRNSDFRGMAKLLSDRAGAGAGDTVQRFLSSPLSTAQSGFRQWLRHELEDASFRAQVEEALAPLMTRYGPPQVDARPAHGGDASGFPVTAYRFAFVVIMVALSAALMLRFAPSGGKSNAPAPAAAAGSSAPQAAGGTTSAAAQAQASESPVAQFAASNSQNQSLTGVISLGAPVPAHAASNLAQCLTGSSDNDAVAVPLSVTLSLGSGSSLFNPLLNLNMVWKGSGSPSQNEPPYVTVIDPNGNGCDSSASGGGTSVEAPYLSQIVVIPGWIVYPGQSPSTVGAGEDKFFDLQLGMTFNDPDTPLLSGDHACQGSILVAGLPPYASQC